MAPGTARTSSPATRARATSSTTGPVSATPDRSVTSTVTGAPSRVPTSSQPGSRRRSSSSTGNTGTVVVVGREIRLVVGLNRLREVAQGRPERDRGRGRGPVRAAGSGRRDGGGADR